MDFKQAKRNKKIDIWLSIILLITLFMCVNFIISKLKYSVDITKDSKYSLSPETIGRLNKTTD
jgi:flagellar basal body-associated protein FliL